MRFRKLESVRLSYNRQALIHYTLMCFRDLPAQEKAAIRGKIRRACGEKLEGEYYDAVCEWLTGGSSMRAVIAKYGVSDKQLLRIRKRLFEHW